MASKPTEVSTARTDDNGKRIPSKKQLFITIPALFLALFLAALDATIVSPALPAISEYFQSTVGYVWIGSAYLLAHAASGPLWGKFSDIWGRKPVLLAAISIFFIGSLICAAATSAQMLIGGRAVQGSAAGGLVILVNICISDLFNLRERSLYLGLTGVVWALASGTGPIIGGAFADGVSWRWIWWINLPICALAFILIISFLKIDRPRATPAVGGLKAVDWFGSISILGSTIMLLLSLQLGGVSYAWNSATIICMIVFGILLLVFFFYNEAKIAKQPVIPLRLFGNRSSTAALLVCFFHGLTYISAIYYLPLYFQAVGGSTALQSGLLIIPIALTQTLTGVICGVIVKITGRYLELIWVGMTLMTLGFYLFLDFTSKFDIAKIIIFQMIAGMGVGICFQTPLIALQAHIKQEDIATATATFGFMRNIGTCMSIAIGGIIFQNGMKKEHKSLASALGEELAKKFSAGSAGANVNMVASLLPAQRIVVREAYVVSLRDMWLFFACTAATGLVASTFIARPRVRL